MKLNGIDLNKIHVFLAVVRHQGYRGAAEELQLTRSALSQSVASLEATLGVPLFHRVGTKLVLTSSAQRFYEEVSVYQSRLQDSVTHLIGQTGKAEGILTIGAYLEFAKSKLMPVIEDFLGRNPKAQIKFVFGGPSRLAALLESGKIDFSISVFPDETKTKTRSKRIYQEELVLVGLPKLISAKPKFDSFSQVPVIDYFPNHQLFKRWWKLHFGNRLLRSPVRSFAASADMVIEMTKRGLGVGVVPRYVFETSEAFNVAQIIQPTEKRLYDFIWLNERSRTKKSLVHLSFVELLSARFPAI